MKTIKWILVILLVGLIGIDNLSAQIGYQVSLLNSATGEARANEKVTVNISLSNSEGAVFYNEAKQATTNDFGVLSLTIGNEDTFSEVDLSKLPFFISVTVNGVLVGRTQVLTVLVAEAAKRIVPLDKEKIAGTWDVGNAPFGRRILTLSINGTGTIYDSGSNLGASTFRYEIEGNTIYCYATYIPDLGQHATMILRYSNGKIYVLSQF